MSGHSLEQSRIVLKRSLDAAFMSTRNLTSGAKAVLLCTEATVEAVP